MAVSKVDLLDGIFCCLDMFLMMAVHFHGSVFYLEGEAIFDFGGVFLAGLGSGVNFFPVFFEGGERG